MCTIKDTLTIGSDLFFNDCPILFKIKFPSYFFCYWVQYVVKSHKKWWKNSEKSSVLNEDVIFIGIM